MSGDFVFVVESEDNIIVEGNLRYSTSRYSGIGNCCRRQFVPVQGYSKVETTEQMLPYKRCSYPTANCSWPITITVEEQRLRLCTAELNYCLHNDGNRLKPD